MKNIPKRIYLQLGEDCDCKDFNEAMRKHGEDLTWCEDKIHHNDIEYILASERSGK